MTPSDSQRRVLIRGQEICVPQATARSLAHCAYHIGQTVQSARVVAGESWQTLTIPRGESEAYNRRRWGQG
ncbi:DUF1572 family protein [Botrimarina hoheduenensis]|uniref:DUF1572 family protein n=1 Tax=Botrimarina hoheduenensis TaxID=2528000 RepID=UPI0011B40B62